MARRITLAEPLRNTLYGAWPRRPTVLTYTLILRSYSTPAQQKSTSPTTAYDRLRPVMSTFQAPIDWAAAYGSGVLPQASYKPPAPGEAGPLTDLLIATPDAEVFHKINLAQNPGHYPVYARWMGGKGVGWVQEKWGAGVWYVTMVDINGVNVKYGVISTPTLEKDLKEWTTFYLSGRLHKPVLTLLPPPSSLSSALSTNSHSALSLALLLLPPSFTEDALWEQIAGLSYSGDPRMSVPGAENPEKVKNIVKGEGAREGFRRDYGGLLRRLGISWEGEEKGGKKEWEWKGNGEDMMIRPDGSEYLVSLTLSLPLSLRQSLTVHYPTLSSASTEHTSWAPVVQDSKFRANLSEALRKIIHGPALRQSIKGLFTAGPVKSFWYSLAKVGKWFKGRKQK
ncbi:mitochondrial matrix protein import protein [Cryptococcus deuterogattii 99/473]|uniref:Phosphatidate cytidylyltransferase, mitochondrial n=1 Tax=Cryptococcus deuterogattii Ram5 TaxID=1296110 RepID=A0A0D0V6T2_9TREE|nr:mitochondrial matrix protein import protein [Cryptococcus deuterogattii LA55]KIR43061.1 mitochondrial matrix protein import protein [Cryptococcus deuterogattii Ram5]KIR95354.1 mitochondrial matrix protein import protein [Cryptococcus deuterogattii CBS 10090]KIY56398.1 mitochondrial matrix protein import protein [Cryptococcus deuterogattii 99/473]